jgi:hypothetical protein
MQHNASRQKGEVPQDVTAHLGTPPSTRMIAGHLDSDNGKTAGMDWSDKDNDFGGRRGPRR